MLVIAPVIAAEARIVGYVGQLLSFEIIIYKNLTIFDDLPAQCLKVQFFDSGVDPLVRSVNCIDNEILAGTFKLTPELSSVDQARLADQHALTEDQRCSRFCGAGPHLDNVGIGTIGRSFSHALRWFKNIPNH